MKILTDYSLMKIFGIPPRRKKALTKKSAITKSLNAVTEIVIHHTAGDGNWKGLLSWFTEGTNKRRNLYFKFIGFTHFYIEKSGEIFKAFPLTRWLYHSCSGKHDRFSIGIELIHRKGSFSDEQYSSLAWLIQELIKDCPNVMQIVSHDYNYMTYSNDAKGCPGKEFDFDLLNYHLEEREIFIQIKTLSSIGA